MRPNVTPVIARCRRRVYQAGCRRKAAQDDFADAAIGFLRALGMEPHIGHAGAEDLSRRGTHPADQPDECDGCCYPYHALRKLVSDPRHAVRVATLTDRFVADAGACAAPQTAGHVLPGGLPQFAEPGPLFVQLPPQNGRNHYCSEAEYETRHLHSVLETRFPASYPGGGMRDELTTDAAEQLSEQLDRESGSKCSFAGIGIGPANLSLAALAEPVLDLTYKFFDTRLEFAWHPGLNLPEATLQVSFLKDLVTLVDPTSPYSFLSFLAENKRLYRFLTASFPAVLRAEYDQYLRWATTVIPGLHFGHDVTAVDFDDRNQEFRIETTRGRFAAENLVLGTGLSPRIPEACLPHLGEQVFHASEFVQRDLDLRGMDVVVLGGGQTGAEVFLNLVRDGARPRHTSWITRRANFLPLDDSPFTNELFFPNYAQYFHGENVTRKEQLLSEQKLASDGISASTLDEIYRELYAMECVQNQTDLYGLFPENELVGLDRNGDKLSLTIQSTGCKDIHSIEADTLILATGYHYRSPDFLTPLLPRINMSQQRFKIREDYSLDWDGPPNSNIYVQNAGRHEWGVADPNLSLLSWRSATIINSLVGYPRYDIAKTSSALHFGAESARDSVERLHEEQLDEVF